MACERQQSSCSEMEAAGTKGLDVPGMAGSISGAVPQAVLLTARLGRLERLQAHLPSFCFGFAKFATKSLSLKKQID